MYDITKSIEINEVINNLYMFNDYINIEDINYTNQIIYLKIYTLIFDISSYLPFKCNNYRIRIYDKNL